MGYGLIMPKRLWTLLVALIAVATLLAVTAWRDTHTVRLREVVIPVSGLSRDVTILHTSDLHGARFGVRQADIAALIEGRSFDAAVMTGDTVPSFEADPAPGLELLAVLQQHAPIVLLAKGNHDSEEQLAELTAEGAVRLWGDAEAITVAPDAGRIVALPQARLNEAPRDADLVLGIGHKPYTWWTIEALTSGMDAQTLFLDGHTHGGQVRLPLLGAIWAPANSTSDGNLRPREDFGNFFPELRGNTISGLTERGGSLIHISAGLGTQGLPLRLLCPAEITVITLQAQP